MSGCASKAAADSTSTHNAHTISALIHRTNLVFVTTSGPPSPYPTGALTPGDRVLGRDDILQQGSRIGSDYEVCTVNFDLHVLCDDMVEITSMGQVHLTWMFQWPSSGTTGPSAWQGVVDGGTGAYATATGDFQAQALPGGDDSITVRIVKSA
jgi:hypothetical protein